ncbi:ATP-binding protein [Cyclobacterium xiamenense]|uniref:sensor histidine kinase n=1 Tax=Cyclobacterium xiamenense TaxID=1297121 RepID=UPI0035D12FF4
MEKQRAIEEDSPKTFIERYRRHVFSTCFESVPGEDPLDYWKNYLFVTTLLFIIPLCSIALIPGVYLSYLTSLTGLLIADILAVVGLLLIAHVRGIPLAVRKWVFIGIIYAIGLILIYYLGNYGPGLLYLLAVSVFMILVFPENAAWTGFYLNLAACLLFGGVIYLRIPLDGRFSSPIDLQTWIAISSNLIFLNAVFVVLIPKLFKGLQESLREQYLLRRKLEEQQEALKRSLSEVKSKNTDLEHFTYVASHDLQEPLRMVTGFMSLLEKRYSDQLDAKGKTYIRHAVDGATRMRQLILDLLKYSRIHPGTDPIEEVDVQRLFDEVIHTLSPEIRRLDATITHGPLPTIISHHSFLFLVLQNLVSNALKYAKRGIPPEIHLSCEEQEETWLFWIRDNGIGIEQEYFERIFVIFQRLHQKDAYDGTGMGLAIVKKIVESMEGKIWLQSRAGQGTTFYFTVPKHASNPKSQALLRT